MYNNLFVVLGKKKVILSPITCAYLYNNSVVGKKTKWYDSNYNFKIYLLIYISPIECTFQKKVKYYRVMVMVFSAIFKNINRVRLYKKYRSTVQGQTIPGDTHEIE
jgi:hypothetical protein